jgi:hypothetical protein
MGQEIIADVAGDHPGSRKATRALKEREKHDIIRLSFYAVS